MIPDHDRAHRLLARKAELLGFLTRRVGNRADAEDLLQTAFVRLLEARQTLRDEARLVPWFYRVLANLVADALAWQWRELFFGGSATASPVRSTGLDRVGWLGSPGPLGSAHASLSNDCRACHVPFGRVPDARCLNCHARSVELLRRLDTAFHAEARRCVTCHVEHLGRAARISRMEHAVLDPGVACTSCHVDRHQAVLGDRCAECHRVETWKVAGFRHPSPASHLCSQCHEGPPSHYMGHFVMVDRTITGQRDAVVEQCWRCHTTDHWNNITGVGFYKHH